MISPPAQHCKFPFILGYTGVLRRRVKTKINRHFRSQRFVTNCTFEFSIYSSRREIMSFVLHKWGSSKCI